MRMVKNSNNQNLKKISNKLVPLGWREWVYLPFYNNFPIRAKIDTGARTSSLHATHISKYKKEGKDRIKFRIHQSNKFLSVDTSLIKLKKITNSFGDSETRPVIKMKIKLGNNSYNTEITLSKRSRMSYPMLIGRNSLKKMHVIHSHKSFLTGQEFSSPK